MKIGHGNLFLISVFALVIFFVTSCGVVEYEKKKCPEDKFVQELWLIDLNQNTETLVSHGTNPVFSADSRHVIFIDDSNAVVSFDLQTQTVTPLVSSFKYVYSLTITYETNWLALSVMNFASASVDIFILRPDGSGLRNLTYSNSQNENDPSFSSDGKWIVFKEGSGVSMTNFQGEKRTLITGNTGSIGFPRLTITGNKLVFLHYPDKNVKICDLKDSTKDTTIQIAGEHFDVSPTKDEILYFYYGGLYVMDTNTFAKEKIADYGRSFSYSPDGQWVVFIDLNDRIILKNIETGVQKVVRESSRNEMDTGTISLCRISPDNQRIVFQRSYTKRVIP